MRAKGKRYKHLLYSEGDSASEDKSDENAQSVANQQPAKPRQSGRKRKKLPDPEISPLKPIKRRAPRKKKTVECEERKVFSVLNEGGGVQQNV